MAVNFLKIIFRCYVNKAEDEYENEYLSNVYPNYSGPARKKLKTVPVFVCGSSLLAEIPIEPMQTSTSTNVPQSKSARIENAEIITTPKSKSESLNRKIQPSCGLDELENKNKISENNEKTSPSLLKNYRTSQTRPPYFPKEHIQQFNNENGRLLINIPEDLSKFTPNTIPVSTSLSIAERSIEPSLPSPTPNVSPKNSEGNKDNSPSLFVQYSMGGTKLPTYTQSKIQAVSLKQMYGYEVRLKHLYSKYFSKEVQDNIIDIAKMVIIICSSNIHHEIQLEKLSKINNEEQKSKLTDFAKENHRQHKRTVKLELIFKFTNLILTITNTGLEYELVFQMFFLAILKVVQVLNLSYIKDQLIFIRLTFLLRDCLNSKDYIHSKCIKIMNTENFRFDCVRMFEVIEGFKNDGEMEFFFKTEFDSLNCFPIIMDYVSKSYVYQASNIEEDPKILLENNASSQCRRYSKIDDPVDRDETPVKSDRKIASDVVESFECCSNDILR